MINASINPYFNHTTETVKGSSSNVWQFVQKNERGATYEFKSTAKKYDEERLATKKYITLNQVQVNFSGGQEKLLIVRDVSHMIYLEQIMETKHEMFVFTQSLMN